MNSDTGRFSASVTHDSVVISGHTSFIAMRKLSAAPVPPVPHDSSLTIRLLVILLTSDCCAAVTLSSIMEYLTPKISTVYLHKNGRR